MSHVSFVIVGIVPGSAASALGAAALLLFLDYAGHYLITVIGPSQLSDHHGEVIEL